MPERRVIYIVPPGAVTRVGVKVPGSSSSVPLWLYWAKIARMQARLAREARESDEMLDFFSASLAGEERKRPDSPGPVAWHEMLAALVAIAGAAHALDGFYGTVKPMVCPPP